MASKKILLVSDIDGTLVDGYMNMPQKNIEAAERLMSEGHYFTIATGRSRTAAQRYAEAIGANVPAICYNGSALYDYNKKEYVLKRYLPKTAYDIVKDIYSVFPEVGIEVHTPYSLYMIRHTYQTEIHVKEEKIDFTPASLDEVRDENWLKVLFTAPDENMDRLAEFTSGMGETGLEFVRSGGMYFEMLGGGVNKGTTIGELAKILGVDISDVYAIGDYFNDVGMLKAAGHAAAPAGAPAEVKALCEYAACPVEQGAVADYIGYILESIK